MQHAHVILVWIVTDSDSIFKREKNLKVLKLCQWDNMEGTWVCCTEFIRHFFFI